MPLPDHLNKICLPSQSTISLDLLLNTLTLSSASQFTNKHAITRSTNMQFTNKEEAGTSNDISMECTWVLKQGSGIGWVISSWALVWVLNYKKSIYSYHQQLIWK